MCDLRPPQGTVAVGTAHTSSPSKLRHCSGTRQHCSCTGRWTTCSWASHLPLTQAPSARPAGPSVLCVEPASNGREGNWERKKSKSKSFRLGFPQNDVGLWLMSAPRRACKEVPPPDTQQAFMSGWCFGHLDWASPEQSPSPIRAPKCPPHLLISLGLFSLLQQGNRCLRAGPKHLPAKPATEPGPAAAALPPACAPPGRHLLAAYSQPPVSAPGAAGHPAAVGSRAPWCCAGLSLGSH